MVGVSEIAERLGLSKKRADQIVREKGFPEAKHLKMGLVFDRQDVEAWIARRRQPKGAG